MQIERLNSQDLVVSSMPDGSRVVRNSKTETVFALNPTAASAWDACSCATTVDEVAEEMRRNFDANVTNELAEACVDELQKRNLVKISGAFPKATRREVLAGLGAVALPLVVSLTIGEQKAHAERASSTDFHGPRADVPKHNNRAY